MILLRQSAKIRVIKSMPSRSKTWVLLTHFINFFQNTSIIVITLKCKIFPNKCGPFWQLQRGLRKGDSWIGHSLSIWPYFLPGRQNGNRCKVFKVDCPLSTSLPWILCCDAKYCWCPPFFSLECVFEQLHPVGVIFEEASYSRSIMYLLLVESL